MSLKAFIHDREQLTDPVYGALRHHHTRICSHLVEEEPHRTGLVKLQPYVLEGLLHSLRLARDLVVDLESLAFKFLRKALLDEDYIDIGIQQVLYVRLCRSSSTTSSSSDCGGP
jgi:hypothetical protein